MTEQQLGRTGEGLFSPALNDSSDKAGARQASRAAESDAS
jgi:hypothetical protein